MEPGEARCNFVKHWGIPAPVFVYLLYDVLKPPTRDRAMYLTEMLMSAVPRELFLSMVAESAAEDRVRMVKLGASVYDFVWNTERSPTFERHLHKLLVRMHKRLGDAFIPLSAAREATEVETEDGSMDAGDTVLNFALPREWFSSIRRPHDPRSSSKDRGAHADAQTHEGHPDGRKEQEDEGGDSEGEGEDSEASEEEGEASEEEEGEASQEEEGEDSSVANEEEVEDEDEGLRTTDGSTFNPRNHPGHYRVEFDKDTYDCNDENRPHADIDDPDFQIPNVQTFASGSIRYQQRSHLTDLVFAPISSYTKIRTRMLEVGQEYEVARIERFFKRNGGIYYCQLMLLETQSLAEHFEHGKFTHSYLILLLHNLLISGYGELEYLHDMHHAHFMAFPFPHTDEELASGQEPQILVLFTRTFFQLLQAACLRAEGRETLHFNRMPMTLRAVKRAFHLPPTYLGLPSKYGQITSHLRQPLYEHLFYWVRSEYFRKWSWDRVAYPIHSKKFEVYRLIFPILSRFSAPVKGQDPEHRTLIEMIHEAYNRPVDAPRNILASIEAFFLQAVAERYHCISKEALMLLRKIVDGEQSDRANALRTQFAAFVENVRGLWDTFLNMPDRDSANWIPLGFFPFTYSKSWCRAAHRRYKRMCIDAGSLRKNILGYRTWLRERQKSYVPSYRIAMSIYMVCATNEYLTAQEARTVFLGIRTRAHAKPIYLNHHLKRHHKSKCEINMVPPTDDQKLRRNWHHLRKAYPPSLSKPNIHRISDYTAPFDCLYRDDVDMISVPEYASMKFSDMYQLSEIAVAYEISRLLEFTYRIPHTLHNPERSTYSFTDTPIKVDREEEIYRPVLYPSAVRSLDVPTSGKKAGTAAVPDVERMQFLYDDYHLSYYTTEGAVQLWATNISPWMDTLDEYPPYIHEIALLYAPQFYRNASYLQSDAIRSGAVTDPTDRRSQAAAHASALQAFRRNRLQGDSLRRARAVPAVPRVRSSMQIPAHSTLPIPKKSRAPPRYDAIEHGTISNGLTDAPMDLDKLEAEGRRIMRQQPGRGSTSDRKRRRATGRNRGPTQKRARTALKQRAARARGNAANAGTASKRRKSAARAASSRK